MALEKHKRVWIETKTKKILFRQWKETSLGMKLTLSISRMKMSP